MPPINPPQKLKDLQTALMIFGFTVVGIGLRYAWDAFRHFNDYNQLTTLDHWTTLVRLSFNGFIYGLIPGTVVGLFIVLAAAAGPEVWGWIGPIIVAAAKNTVNFVRGMSRAFRAQPLTPRRRKTTNKKAGE
jgi:hypothetical protein